MRTPVSVGVVGPGPGALRLARVFDDSPQAEVRWLSETRQLDVLLADESVDVVALATTSRGRVGLTRRALEAGKHAYVEGPLGASAREVEELLAFADASNRRLMVGHALLFHPAVRKLKELIELGRLGDVYYLTAVLQTGYGGCDGEDVVAALGGEAVAVLLYLVADEPVRVQAATESYDRPGTAEVACGYLRFATGITATVQLSSLDAREACRFAAVGSRKTGVFDAGAAQALTIFERGSSRGAEIVSPRLPADDALRVECECFLTGVRSAAEFPGARLEPAVARVVEALAGEPADAPARPGRPHLRLALPTRK